MCNANSANIVAGVLLKAWAEILVLVFYFFSYSYRFFNHFALFFG